MATTRTTSTVRDAIVPYLLNDYNYQDWSNYMKNYLMAQHLWSIVEDAGHLVSPLDKAKNAAALHAIHITCSSHIFGEIKSIRSAKVAWEKLAEMYQEEESEEDVEQFKRGELEMMEPKMGDWLKLRQGIWKGEWVVVNEFIQKYSVNKVVDEADGTALHLAIEAGQEEMAEKLVEMMSTTDLEIKNTEGVTALHLAASKGRLNTAKCLVQKHQTLLTISSDSGWGIPIVYASTYGREEMTRYLYSDPQHSVPQREILRQQNCIYGFRLLRYCIYNKMFDFCLKLLRDIPELAVSNNGEAQSPIFVLSTQPSAFYSGCRLSFWQRWIYHYFCLKLLRDIPELAVSNNGEAQSPIFVLSTQPSAFYSGCRISFWQRWIYHLIDWIFGANSNIPTFLGIKEIYNLRLSHRDALEVLRCMSNYVALLNTKQYHNIQLYKAIFEAVKRGTYEFLIELWRTIPASRLCVLTNRRSVLMVAIQYRQEKVFQLFYDMSETLRADCVRLRDKESNNILHCAGELAPDSQLSRISGAALQMQRELQWFKDVERITPTGYKEAKNKDGLTPRELFTESHKELLKEGEKWMKDTASSFIIVGALIVTIMFAVAFTVPGGNDQNTGFPIFLGEKSFKIFVLSDAISFFAAATSILMFLGILTSRYAEDDFLVSLPTKLIIGLSALFISTAAMMVSFSDALLIMLQGKLWATIPTVSIASIPITLFVWLQFPLLVRIFVSTYDSRIFCKKKKLHLS